MTFESHNLSVTAKGALPRVPFADVKKKILGDTYDLSVVFLPPKEARALNIAHRGKDYVPNTLSFPLTKKSGEIILCQSAMRAQYKSFGMNYHTYVLFIIIHSMLHLKGYSHGSTMEHEEKKLLAFFT